MTLRKKILITTIITSCILIFSFISMDKFYSNSNSADTINLPAPSKKSAISIEEALLNRRSVREYSNKPLTLGEISQLLWAAQGITGPNEFRTAPSAGALYPIELTLIAIKISGLEKAVYRYIADGHKLKRTLNDDVTRALSSAALSQDFIEKAAAIIVISALYDKTTSRYHERGVRYVHIEAGHVAQNIHLQAVSLNIGTVVIGAFYDDAVRKVLRLGEKETPLCIMPLGKI